MTSTTHTTPTTTLTSTRRRPPGARVAHRPAPPATSRRIPLARLVAVELRKSFDTRSGIWLLASIVMAAFLTTGAVIAWAPEEQFTYSTFTLAIGYPMSVILPIIAALSVTAEWSQRSGLTTFTLAPHRGRVLLAKAVAAVLLALPCAFVAFAVGALGNLIGTAVAGIPTVWDQDLADFGYFVLGNALLLLVGFTLGALIRNSAGAVVGYMLYAFVAPGLLAFLALNQAWFRDARPWVDPKYNQDALLHGGLTAEQWAQLGVTSVLWLALPLLAATVTVLRSEVK
jgi:ABC-2 type transport system permease protein